MTHDQATFSGVMKVLDNVRRQNDPEISFPNVSGTKCLE